MGLNTNTEAKLTQLVASAAAAWNVLKDAAKTATQRRHAAFKLNIVAGELSDLSAAAGAELEADANTETGL